MTIAIPAPADAPPPPLGERPWDPDAMADVVFPEPATKRSLAVDQVAVQAYWDRAVAEVRWLHELLEEFRNQFAEMKAARGGDPRRVASEEADRILDYARGQAVAEATKIRDEALADARAIRAQAVTEVTRLTRMTSSPELAALPAYTQNAAGSLEQRTDVALDQVEQVRREAEAMAAASAKSLARLSAAVPAPEPAPVVTPGEAMQRASELLAMLRKGPMVVEQFGGAGQGVDDARIVLQETDALRAARSDEVIAARQAVEDQLQPRDERGRFTATAPPDYQRIPDDDPVDDPVDTGGPRDVIERDAYDAAAEQRDDPDPDQYAEPDPYDTAPEPPEPVETDDQWADDPDDTGDDEDEAST